MEVGKVLKRGEDFFDFFFVLFCFFVFVFFFLFFVLFLFCFVLFCFVFFFAFHFRKRREFVFLGVSNKNGNFLPGKNISRREKIRKNDFAPSEKYACYAPDQLVYSVIKSIETYAYLSLSKGVNFI